MAVAEEEGEDIPAVAEATRAVVADTPAAEGVAVSILAVAEVVAPGLVEVFHISMRRRAGIQPRE